jgi:hypothetical protein
MKSNVVLRPRSRLAVGELPKNLSSGKRERTGVSCPACGAHKVGVYDSRWEGGATRRNRACRACAYRWTTYEVEAVELARLQSADAFMRHLARQIAPLLKEAAPEIAAILETGESRSEVSLAPHASLTNRHAPQRDGCTSLKTGPAPAMESGPLSENSQ